jgi:hypothetical protein
MGTRGVSLLAMVAIGASCGTPESSTASGQPANGNHCRGVVCTPLDQCHVAGTCNPSTGTCSNPTKADGTACTDGNACTRTDTCQSGSCVGANPVVCNALDQCHSAGTCDPMNGACSNPAKTNGTTCDDGSACTQHDSCQSGFCVGATTVVCNALDQCHSAGTCDPATGICSNPTKTNGANCNDGDPCTQTDTCQGGSCIGANPVVCNALDQCHLAGTCDPSTGACSNPAMTNGTACNDGSACTQADTCQSGSCIGANLVVCNALDQCHVAGTCDPSTGLCSNPAQSNGTGCNDGDACTRSDACQGGACVGSPMVCAALDSCHAAGVCDHSSGICSNPTQPDGTACMLPNATAACSAGACAITSCATGFADCDAQPADGCEASLTSSALHCGSCSHACPGGKSAACVAGYCAPLDCAQDDLTGIAATGSITTGPSNGFVPLCSGVVLLGDSAANQIVRLNVPGNTVLLDYPLTASPGRLLLDSERGYLYVAESPAQILPRIDLFTGNTVTVALPGGATGLALGNDGLVFAAMPAVYTGPAAIVDGSNAALLATVGSDFGPVLGFDRATARLVSVDIGLSPSGLRRYAFDPVALTLTKEQSLLNAGYNGQDLALSPDGSRVAFPCGGGNGTGYSIYDWGTMDFTIAGAWQTGAYPRAAAFSPDGSSLLASDGTRILVFDAVSHALTKSWTAASCPYGQVTAVGWSRGGRIVYAFTLCGFNRDSGRITWAID